MRMVNLVCLALISVMLSACSHPNDYETLKNDPKFIALLMEQQQNAEAFGMRIMQAQNEYVAAKIRVKQLKANIANNKPGLENELLSAEKNCSDKRTEVKMLLAVVGLGAPD